MRTIKDTIIDLYFEQMYERVIMELQVNRSDLRAWNQAQADLWMQMTTDIGIDPNDVQIFFGFGKFFADYVASHGGEAPDYQEVMTLFQFDPKYYT